LQIEETEDHESPSQKSDFAKITGVKFLDLCTGMLAYTRKKFLDEKFKLAIAQASGLTDAPREASRRCLEAYLAWWFFRDRYAHALAPTSARRIVTFRDYYKDYYQRDTGTAAQDQRADDASQKGRRHPKRLIIALYENPANYTLIQQVGDEDANLSTWLYQQILESVWVKQRQFKVNTRILPHDQYAYDYIRFRLDVGLATPVRDNAEEAVPNELLPQPKGRRHMLRFF